MDKDGKYNIKNIKFLNRDSEEWNEFVGWQKSRILERLNRYNNINTTKEQLIDHSGQSPYQHYKVNTVSKFLIETLNRIDKEEYGKCKYCNCDIPNERLLLVPAALQCLKCDAEHKQLTPPNKNSM